MSYQVTSSTSMHECDLCHSDDAGTTREEHDVLGTPVVGIWEHCNRCGGGTLHIRVGDKKPELVEEWKGVHPEEEPEPTEEWAGSKA